MRILVINWQDWTHPRSGGAEIHLRETFRRIAERGHPIDLLCTAHPGAPPEETLDEINIIRRGLRYPLFNYSVRGVYRRLLRRNRYDVVVDDLNKVPFFSPLFVDAPVVALVHHLFGETIFEETNPLFGGYLYLSERPIAHVYRKSPFIAVSESTADDLARRGVDRGKITVIPNGLDDLPYEQWLAMPKAEDPLFVYLGRIKRYKRIELILEAFARLVEAQPKAHLVIAGEGSHRPALEQTAADLDLGGRVIFAGWVEEEEKWSLLRRAWALCYTSPKEGWGISSLEAQRVGTVALVSDAPGLRETVEPDQTGIVVPHADLSAMVEAMQWVIEHPDGRKDMERAAVSRAEGYSWDRGAERTLAVLRSAVEAPL